MDDKGNQEWLTKLLFVQSYQPDLRDLEKHCLEREDYETLSKFARDLRAAISFDCFQDEFGCGPEAREHLYSTLADVAKFLAPFDFVRFRNATKRFGLSLKESMPSEMRMKLHLWHAMTSIKRYQEIFPDRRSRILETERHEKLEGESDSFRRYLGLGESREEGFEID